MNKLAKWILVIIVVTAVCTATTEAAKWEFRSTGRGYSDPNNPDWGVYDGDGWLTVYPTINCNKQDPNLFDRDYIYWDQEYEGTIPGGKGYNDYTAYFEWDYPCENKVWYKGYACPDGELKPKDLPRWINDELTAGAPISLPSLGDPTGANPDIYIVVNLRIWNDSPTPQLQESYDIINGVCEDLPGYRVGTTPFRYEEGEECHPFVTNDPFTGTLYPHADLSFEPSIVEPPAVSEWGLIVMALLLVAVGAIMIRKRRQLAT